jgi:hypothetical protein
LTEYFPLLANVKRFEHEAVNRLATARLQLDEAATVRYPETLWFWISLRTGKITGKFEN